MTSCEAWRFVKIQSAGEREGVNTPNPPEESLLKEETRTEREHVPDQNVRASMIPQTVFKTGP